jgi:hypothetical protein
MVGGSYDGSGREDAWMVWTDASGDVVLESELSLAPWADVTAIHELPSGDLLVAGNLLYETGHTEHAYMMKTTAEGTPVLRRKQWGRIYSFGVVDDVAVVAVENSNGSLSIIGLDVPSGP